MSKATNKSAAFLAALTSPPTAANTSKPAPEPSALKPARAPSRTGLKHIGAYLDRADVEKIAILRARLGLDNSQLVKLAIEELYRKHEAKRAFGDT